MIVNVRFRNLKNSTVLMWTSTPEAEAASSVGENKARRPVWGQKVGHDGRLVSACFKSWFMDSNLTFVFSSVTSTESHVTLRKLNCWEQKKNSSSGLDFLRQCLGEMLVITRSRWTTQSDAASVDSWLLRLFLFTTHFTICNIQVNIPTYCPLPTPPSSPNFPTTSSSVGVSCIEHSVLQ